MKAMTVSPARQFNPDIIDQHQYTLSLLSEGRRAGIFTENKVEHIQTEMMALLSKAIPNYTRHESNSVPAETAQSIMQSILYNMDTYLRSMSTPEQAMETLNSLTLEDCYTRGVSITMAMFQEAKALWQQVMDGKLSVPVTAYTETIDSGFAEFFYRYDVNYGAHLAEVSVDYPLLFDDTNWNGVIYVSRYLKALTLENQLCRKFSQPDLLWLVDSCGKKFNTPSCDLIVNLADLALRNSLATVILGKKAGNLRLSDQDCQRLTMQLDNKSAQQCHTLIRKALNTMLTDLSQANPELRNYLLPYPELLCPQLENAIRDNALQGVFVLDQEPEQTELMHYIPGKRLNDEELRLIIEALSYCKDGASKADFLAARVKNIEDLLEILGAYRFYNQEFFILFDRLSDFELALLTKYSALTDKDCHEPAFSWQTQLTRYLKSSPKHKLIREIAEKLTFPCNVHKYDNPVM